MKQKYCLVDTNVPLTADKMNDSDSDLAGCAIKCLEQIQDIMQNYGLVLDSGIDSGRKIMGEYGKNLTKDKQSISYAFFMWANDYLEHNYVTINETNGSYKEFPTNPELNSFDPADRKFIAVANSYKDKPITIFQATDSKWLGFKEVLQTIGINIHFVCEEYAQKMYKKKMG
ncbi:MAG: hypothetical protein LBV04_09915 [Deferribacteraceae bacterium]|jgi:hypothetical protein|nr:hypothetical protein [Deferribacteraceae bacterium]